MENHFLPMDVKQIQKFIHTKETHFKLLPKIIFHFSLLKFLQKKLWRNGTPKALMYLTIFSNSQSTGEMQSFHKVN